VRQLLRRPAVDFTYLISYVASQWDSAPPNNPKNNVPMLCAALQVRFFEVSETELEDLRERFKNGQYSIDIEHKTFSMEQYNDMLASGWSHC
jgi:hypothetical protein